MVGSAFPLVSVLSAVKACNSSSSVAPSSPSVASIIPNIRIELEVFVGNRNGRFTGVAIYADNFETF